MFTNVSLARGRLIDPCVHRAFVRRCSCAVVVTGVFASLQKALTLFFIAHFLSTVFLRCCSRRCICVTAKWFEHKAPKHSFDPFVHRAFVSTVFLRWCSRRCLCVTAKWFEQKDRSQCYVFRRSHARSAPGSCSNPGSRHEVFVILPAVRCQTSDTFSSISFLTRRMQELNFISRDTHSGGFPQTKDV